MTSHFSWNDVYLGIKSYNGSGEVFVRILLYRVEILKVEALRDGKVRFYYMVNKAFSARTFPSSFLVIFPLFSICTCYYVNENTSP